MVQKLLFYEDYTMRVAEKDIDIIGFIIGKLIQAPEVYDPGGLTLMIDDFCVKEDDLWYNVGKKLVSEIKLFAKVKGALKF